MRVLIVDQCSGTKDYPEGYPVIEQSETRNADSDDVLREFGIDGIKSKDLYSGKQQKRISDSVRILEKKENEVKRVFISAGFGLVDADQRLPPYEATFNSMSKSEIAERTESFRLTERLINLINGEDFDIVFFPLGSKYYEVLELEQLLTSISSDVMVVLFNQEEVENSHRQAVSIPARTEQGKQFGSTVVGLKGTYLKNFATALDSTESSVDYGKIVEYCRTDMSDSSQSEIGNYS